MFSAVGTTYGAGDGSTTFALPNLMDKFVEGSSTAGTVKSAGLPNITGKIDNGSLTASCLLTADATYTTQSGALGLGKFSAKGNTMGGGSDYAHEINFDASKSNSIYGKSATVQPPALTMKPFIYTGKTSVNKWKRTA